MAKIGLLICVGDACGGLDQAMAVDRGVELLAFPEAAPAGTASAQDLCNRVSAAVNHYLCTCGGRGAGV